MVFVMNADDHGRARALADDLQAVQEILKRWADENQRLADENERLRTDLGRRTHPPEAKAGDPTFLSPKQLGIRWGMHHESIRRKLRQRELPCLLLNSRSVRVAMTDVLAYEAQNCLGRRR
jgi:regulator of replication initiation timing